MSNTYWIRWLYVWTTNITHHYLRNNRATNPSLRDPSYRVTKKNYISRFIPNLPSHSHMVLPNRIWSKHKRQGIWISALPGRNLGGKHGVDILDTTTQISRYLSWLPPLHWRHPLPRRGPLLQGTLSFGGFSLAISCRPWRGSKGS